ncbi:MULTISPECIES: DUF1254 domain-containing protein [unclassified Streptomyces]|uniref:DUF1254 domain-containing protein n=1 Tax=unclassified Streptomyces TaxID=2593676 RepID=UPI001319ED8A|nr:MULTISPECIES: DUF1254 domain-containing protein [unclassified Streptomyces]MYX32823.1 DUF1254 domain-containing protein [Streptomyces sp. SID8377]
MVATTKMRHRRGLAEEMAEAAATAVRTTGHAVLHPKATIQRVRRLSDMIPTLRQAVGPLVTGNVGDWHSEYAYTLGEQAFVYGFPYMYNAQLRYDWVTQPRNPATVPYAPVNHFWHAERLLDATYRDGGCPNNDTLYSVAWVDLRAGPVVLSHPEMGDRYFTFELIGITSDNFDYVGQRTTGPAAGHFALVGPDWTGDLPPDVRPLEKAPSPWVLVLGRTLVDGVRDVPTVRELQDRYRLTPLALFGESEPHVPESRDVLKPVTAKEDPLGPWKTLNAMLAENPPPAHHEVLLKQFAQIGVGPGLDIEAQPDAVKRSLVRAAAVGLPMLKQQTLSGDWAHLVHGWRYPPPQMGRFGDDFLKRAADQSLLGVTANDPAEAVYLTNFQDADGNRLSAGGRYELHFDADTMPPAEAFWSLSAYGDDMNLIPNEAGRYSVGDRTHGLTRDAEGGLTIHLQDRSPGSDKEANWLPTSRSGPWFVVLRMYRPRPEVLDATWECPPLIRVG